MYSQRTGQETKGWNLFREFPVKKERGSMITTKWIDVSVKVLKVLAYITTFIAVLGSAVLAKGTLVFITSQLKKDRQISHCNKALALDKQFLTILPLEERVSWLWAALIVFGIPQVGIFLRSVRICFFKTAKKPSISVFVAAFVIETLQTVGIATLLLVILPELDVVKGTMLMNAMCLVPGILIPFNRDSSESRYIIKILLDILAVSAQATAFFVWPLLDGTSALWTIPLACVLISLGWWENFISYIDKHTSLPILYLCELKYDLKRTRYYTQRILSVWKIVVFMVCIVISLSLQGDDPWSFFTSVGASFSDRNYTAYEIQVELNDVYNDVLHFDDEGAKFQLPISWQSPLWVALIQVAAAISCFTSAKFACKILIQKFSFTFALSLVGPVTIILLILFCGIRNFDPCAFRGTIPNYLFFEIPPVYFLWDYVGQEMAWVWLLWLASQAWLSRHAWTPRCERLAATDKLFAKPWYEGALIDQSLLFNRTTDDDRDVNFEKIIHERRHDYVSFADSDVDTEDVKPSDYIPRVYVCATMWHETKDEMMEFLKSIFRMDEDQNARRIAQKYLGIVDPDYYELEVHIFMDDAFEKSDYSSEYSQVNMFVKNLVKTVDEAASEVHLTNLCLRPPQKFPTPYGGRLEWTLPGKNKMICHLKDKSKIRHRKRWSQVMCMYYLLGHRLMDLPLNVTRKDVIAENSYLLALDGDTDFKPSAITSLIDLMKKNKNLGAACGRIHPVGSGFMSWYQKFEYAIGQWLQKATENTMGCVLYSPGCFSLFRGKALMDDNVMKKYTLTSKEARHYIQFDQGEDRWLCNLLLQRGYRIEYSAASDAYTRCPESFNEFFKQRCRWVPSMTANTFDLLADYKRTVKINDNISTLYIVYQAALMGGMVLAPGVILLMMVGAMNAITGFSMVNALLFNLAPVLVFLVVCMTCKSEIQIMLASLITCIYAMIMLMVIVGIVLQIIEDGWLAPFNIFAMTTLGIFIVTALLHPQEFFCLMYILVYYISIPSVHVLLIIYTLCNLNNITWGTREVVENRNKERGMESNFVKDDKKNTNSQRILKWFGMGGGETGGTLEFGIAGLLRIDCCINSKGYKKDLPLEKIAITLEKMQIHLESLGAPPELSEMAPRLRSSMTMRTDSLGIPSKYKNNKNSSIHSVSTNIDEDRDDLTNPYWIEDSDLMKGEVDFLMLAEIKFWKDLIDTYLKPIDENPKEQARIKQDLKNLRDKMVFAFVMLNAMFVLVIFLLQLNQDQLHIKWPFGQKVAITYNVHVNTVVINQEYLKLEPIGFLVLLFFGSVMGIQFVCMLFHRLGTLTHLLSTVQLNWYCTKRPEDLTEHALIEKQAIDIAKDLQKLNTNNIEQHIDETNVSRRNTIFNLERSRDNQQRIIDLDTNFKRRLTILQNAHDFASSLPSLGGRLATQRATLNTLQTRKHTMMAEKRRSQVREESLSAMGGCTSMSRGYKNKRFEPALDSEEEATPLLE